jgi:hypothetical protein
VIVVAGLSVASWTPDVTTAVVLGVLTGMIAAVSNHVGDLWVGALGLVGAFDAAQGLVAGHDCFDAPFSARLGSIGLVLLLGLPSFLVGRHLPGNRRSTSLATYGVSRFASVELVAFLSTPLDVPVIAAGSLGLVLTSALTAVVFGVGFGYAPVLGAVLLGAAVALVSASSAATFGTTCSFAGDGTQLTAVAAFVVIAGLLRTFGGRVTGRV